MIFEKINVNNLLLDLENSRYPSPPENQRQAIEFMLKQQSDKLFRLANDIIEHGLDPSERLVVVKDESQNNVVIEGNRRLTTLKLLQNIDIVDEEKTTRKIKKLLASKPVIPQVVDCVVYQQNDERYEHWINLKHTGENSGIGRVHWKGQEVDRHRAKHGETSFGNQLITFISKEPNLGNEIKLNTHKLMITNITRLLGDPLVRERLSLRPVQGVMYCDAPKEHFVSRLTKLLDEMLETDDNGKVLFTVNRIKKKDDRKDLVNQLGIEASEKKLDRPWKLIEPGSYSTNSGKPATSKNSNSPINGITSTPSNTTESTPTISNANTSDKKNTQSEQKPSRGSEEGQTNAAIKPKDSKKKASKLSHNPKRNMLIPTSCKLKIDDKKSSGLFRELKNKLTFDDHQFSISVLLRVFLEMSISHYMELHKVQLTNPKKTGLHDKVVAVTEDLLTKKRINGSQATALKANSSNYFKSNGAAQQYVHNKYMLPDRESINTMWDNLEPLFEGIWQ